MMQYLFGALFILFGGFLVADKTVELVKADPVDKELDEFRRNKSPVFQPFQVVCNSQGQWNYTDRDGTINPFREPIATREEAENTCEMFRQIDEREQREKEERRNTPSPMFNVRGYKPCNPTKP